MRIVQQSIKESVSHVKFDLSTLMLNQKTPFNLYIKKDKNFLIVIEQGTLISQKVLSMLEKQTALFIQKEDIHKKNLTYKTLRSYLQSNLELKEVTLLFLYEVVQKQFEHMHKHEKFYIDMDFVNSFVGDIIYLIQNDPHYLKNTIKYFSSDYNIAIHSLHIAIYAINIANQLHLKETEILERCV